MQMAVIETMRNVCGVKNAGTTEFGPDCEAVEDMIQVFFFYAYTVVFYLDFDSWVLFGQGYDDFFVFRCVFNGIVKQNAEQLLYHHFVCDNFDVVVDASYGEGFGRA